MQSRREEPIEEPQDRIIQRVSDPFMAHLMSGRLVKTAFKHFSNKRIITCHRDATGKLVRSNAYSGDTI